MATIEELMTANLLEVFGERDAQRRRAAIERTYVPEVRFSDPDEVVVGYDALDAKAQKILDDAPDFVFRAGGPIYINNDLGYLAWELGPEGGPAVVKGVDIALVEGERITSVYTLLMKD